MRRHLLIGTATLAISVALNGPLRAADMPLKAPAPVAPAIFSWNGFYLGGHLGYGSTGFASTISQPALGTHRGTGAVGGLQLGYNIQNGNIVWGLEGDLSAAGLSTNISDQSFRTNTLASVRGRLGIAFDRILVYGTGGWGFVQGQVYSSEPNGGPVGHRFSKSVPVFGGGVEWAATNNLTYRIEALEFVGSKDIGGEDIGGNKLKNTWEVRFGLNYLFNGSDGPGRSAGLPVKGPAAPLFTWSGFYLGGHLGYGSTGFASTLSQPALGTHKGTGAVGGLQLGYNIQNGNIVWGLEGDLSAASLSTNLSDQSFHTNALASLRGRLGIAFDRILVYGTGGWGFVQGKVFSSEPNGGPVGHRFSKSVPVFGGGVEWAATNNLTYRVEALDFVGSKNLTGEDIGGNKLKNTWEVRFGLNYKFDGSPWGKGPVVARY
jgi:outer membrane immunogenic protein